MKKVGSWKSISKKVRSWKLILKKVRRFKSIMKKNVNWEPIFGKLGSFNFNFRCHGEKIRNYQSFLSKFKFINNYTK